MAHPYLIAGGIAAGWFVATKTDILNNLGVGPQKPIDSSKEQPTSAWPSWLNIGDQPATGQGQNPTKTVTAVADAVTSIGKLGVSLSKYFGTHDSNDAPGSIGTNGSGASEWGLPSFDMGGSIVEDGDK